MSDKYAFNTKRKGWARKSERLTTGTYNKGGQEFFVPLFRRGGRLNETKMGRSFDLVDI